MSKTISARKQPKKVSMIDEKRLFAQIGRFFDKPAQATMETIQNAQRSGVTRVELQTHGNTLRVTDNGTGTDNPKAYTKEIEEGADILSEEAA